MSREIAPPIAGSDQAYTDYSCFLFAPAVYLGSNGSLNGLEP